jgi:hypothetical protein
LQLFHIDRDSDESKISEHKKEPLFTLPAFGIKIGWSDDSSACQLVMPESILSYNLTRKYPYDWLGWLFFFGGIAATAIFTVINLAADGYESK